MGRVNRTNDRVLIGELDSAEQAVSLAGDRWLDSLESKHNPVLRNTLGLLRFEALLSKKIVLTDAQALDGRVFLGLAMSGLLAELRPDPEAPVLEIRTRKTGIRRSAWAMFDAQQGGAFRSSFLSHGQGVQEQSPSTNGRGDAIRTIGDYLARSGAEDAEVDALTDGWRAVRAAARKGHLTLEQWDASRPWGTMVALAQGYLPLEHLGALLGDSDDVLNEVKRLAKLQLRSDFLREIEQGTWSQDHRDLLKSWFYESYRRATAFQHLADYRANHSGAIGQVYERYLVLPSTEKRTTYIALPDWFIVQLGRMPRRQWRKLYATNHNDLRRWWSVGDTASLERALMSFSRALEPAVEAGVHTPPSLISLGFVLPANVVALPLAFNAHGIAATVAITIGDAVVGAYAQSAGKGTKIKVTDYLDDVER